MTAVRRFRVPEGRTLTLPADLTEGNGNTTVKAGDTFDIDVARIGVHARFLANRVTLGDLVELTAPTKFTAPAAPAKE